MPKVDLRRLSREGTVRLREEVPPDHPLFEGTDLQLKGPLRVDVTAHVAGSGEVVVRGGVKGTIRQECRRCLKPVEHPVDEDLNLIFAPVGELGRDEELGGIRNLDADTEELDLAGPVREELVLTVSRFPVCDPECRGLCPRCGIDRNVEECDCTLDEADPRWDALRALKSE